MSNLLINEYPRMVLPSLAVAIGVNEAMILQQVHYWLAHSEHEIDGRRWFYKSVADWHKEFPFWCERTIKTILSSLRNKGLLLAERFGKDPRDRTLWYTIDYEVLESLTLPADGANPTPSDSAKFASSDSAKFAPPKGQDLPDVYRTKNPSKNTSERKDIPRKREPRKTLLAEDFAITPSMRSWAQEKRLQVDLDREHERFINHHIAKANKYADWERAWKNWMSGAFVSKKPGGAGASA